MQSLSVPLNHAGDPEQAGLDLEIFLQAYREKIGKSFAGKRDQVAALLPLFGNSLFLAKFLQKMPEVADSTLQSPFLKKQKKRQDFQREITGILKSHDHAPLKALRTYKYTELLRITLKDLEGGHDQAVLAELSDLALCILLAADTLVMEAQTAKWGKPVGDPNDYHHILALGKLGGHELNYSSDIDILYIIKSDDSPLFKKMSTHEFFVRHAQALTTCLQERADQGFLYRVDWDLRPEGKSGTLVNSLSALESYYETFGQDWERQALTKASTGSGSPRLGRDFLRMIHPFVYRKYHDLESIRRIQQIRARLYDEMDKKSINGFNVKLGRGGIREIEFFVQIFLLLYGGQDSKIIHTNTLATIKRLSSQSYISSQDAKFLTNGYLYLRRLENRLQMIHEEQTHFLSNDRGQQTRIARMMGYHESDDDLTRQKFITDLESHTRQVNRIFENLFSELSPAIRPVSFTPAIKEANVLGYCQELGQILDREPQFEHKLEKLRQFKHEKQEEIARLESQKVPREKILYHLSILAEAVCREALRNADAQLRDIYGDPLFSDQKGNKGHTHLCALGMGKLGAHEINYGSDLDLIFIYSDDGMTTGPKKIANAEYFARVVQKFIGILSLVTTGGRAYAIDTELRPSGHQGALVTTLDGFMEYQRQVSQIWERQSLLRARPIAGAPHFAGLVRNHLDALLFSGPHDAGIKNEMQRLRRRVMNEKFRELVDVFNIKIGRGGIMDIEYIIQYHQLLYGYKHDILRGANTYDLCDALCLLPHTMVLEMAKTLRLAYSLYASLSSCIWLHTKKADPVIYRLDPLLQQMAPDLGYQLAEDLWSDLMRSREAVHECYKTTFL